MNLNRDERLQSGMLKARKYLDKRLDDLRKANDALMTEAERAPLLGEIAAVKGFLKFIETKPVAVRDESHFND
ncbi:hypothetical protein GALL_153280 [mine drainage metagenome]|uniref:Uncharacterized protein n=1 Tax=mine drainage metagenome TaxID=410659 RepID=A0A1J5SRA8_9ZZZZ